MSDSLTELRHLVAEAVRLYEAIGRAAALDDEMSALARRAHDLIRCASLSYLIEPAPVQCTSVGAESSGVALADAYADAQCGLADLRNALRGLAVNRLDRHESPNARVILEALMVVSPNDASLRDADRPRLLPS